MVLINAIPVVVTLCSALSLSFSRELLTSVNHVTSRASPDTPADPIKFYTIPGGRGGNESFNILEILRDYTAHSSNISESSNVTIPLIFDATSSSLSKKAVSPVVYLQESDLKGENRNNSDIVPLVPYILQNFIYPLINKLYNAADVLPSISTPQNGTLH